MIPAIELPGLVEGFFTKRLVAQRNVSANTIAAYRDTFRLLFVFADQKLHRSPSQLNVAHLNAELICSFLDGLERERNNSVRTRNLRLAAIRSFFRYAAMEVPEHGALIQRVLAIPPKRCDRKIVGFLTQREVTAILAAVDQSTWRGRRDYAMLLVTMQTGLRLAEVTGLREKDVYSGPERMCAAKAKGEKRDARR